MKSLMQLCRERWFRLGSAMVGIVVPALWMGMVVASSENRLKIRNALVAEVGTLEDFNWTPDRMPATFQTSRHAVPNAFEAMVAHVVPNGTAGGPQGFDAALAIARDLMGGPKGSGDPIQANSETTYRAITTEGRGVCGDFSRAFMAIAETLRMQARTWSISFGGFGSGHAFNEIYDPVRRKWILVDSFNSFYFVDPVSAEPLSVLEVHDRLLSLGRPAGVSIVRIAPDRFAFRSEALALDYYRRGMPQLALVWGSDVFFDEHSWFDRLVAKAPRSLEQAAEILRGDYPGLRIYPVAVSERDLVELFRVRNEFLASVACLATALLIFGCQILAVAVEARGNRRDAHSGAG